MPVLKVDPLLQIAQNENIADVKERDAEQLNSSKS